MDYATLPLAQVKAGLEDVVRDAQATFGGLSATQLNWRPDDARWSVAQCVEHLLTVNALMLQSAEAAMAGTAPRTLWCRLPMWPGFIGRTLIRSQAPEATRKFKAPSRVRPVASDLGADIVQRFVEQHRDALRRLDALDERQAARTIMTSPFISVITYSVLDSWRLIHAHDRRHTEQARRVLQTPGFPAVAGQGL